MCKTLYVLVAVVVAWTGRGAAQDAPPDYGFVTADADGLSARAGLLAIPNFPYRNCNTSSGAYEIAPVVRSLGGGKFCFTVLVPANCSGPCCGVDLHKIEFNVSDSCIVSPVGEAKATINGRPTPVGANYYRSVYGPPGTSVLRLSFLGLDITTAANAELCIALSTNRAGQGCDTLEELCYPAPGYPVGSCSVAFFDSKCKCCPVSHTTPNTPPSRAPPPFAPGFSRCEVCLAVNLLPPTPDVRPYRFDAATCASIQTYIATQVNALIVSSGFPMVSYFAPDPAKCTPLVIAVCGTFNFTADAQSLTDEVQALLPSLIEFAAGGSVCRPELEGYTLEITTDDNVCMPVDQSVGCLIPGTPFPNCTCNITQGLLPFVLSPQFSIGTVTPTTTEYCFTVGVIAPDLVLPSNCGKKGDGLYKVEFYANQNYSSYVKGLNLYPAVGSPVRLRPSWGAPGLNSLKATPINWSLAQANGGEVCVELKKPHTMQELCLGFGGQCFVSTFNTGRNCCPVYRTGSA